MAQVDFSNADIVQIGSEKPLNIYGLALYSSYNSWGNLANTEFTDVSDSSIKYASFRASIITNTATKYSIQYSGTFNSNVPSGSTEFGIYARTTLDSAYHFCWKVSNVSFSAGDTFNFIVDVDVIGS